MLLKFFFLSFSLLQCSHTCCESCIERLLEEEEEMLSCPVCRTVLQASERVHTFPQNTYIIAYIKRNNAFAKCKEHDDKELSLYCKTNDCRKSICQLCLIKEHMGHEVVDIAEEQKEKKETIRNIADELTSHLTVVQRYLLKTKENLEKKNRTTLATLKERRTEAVKLFNKMIKGVTSQINTSNQEVDQEIDIVNRELELVNGLKERTAESCTSDQPDSLAIIQEIQERVEKNFLTSEKSFQYGKFNDNKRAREEHGISITRKTMEIQLFAYNRKSDADIDCPPTKKRRSQKSTPEITWEGKLFRVSLCTARVSTGTEKQREVRGVIKNNEKSANSGSTIYYK